MKTSTWCWIGGGALALYLMSRRKGGLLGGLGVDPTNGTCPSGYIYQRNPKLGPEQAGYCKSQAQMDEEQKQQARMMALCAQAKGSSSWEFTPDGTSSLSVCTLPDGRKFNAEADLASAIQGPSYPPPITSPQRCPIGYALDQASRQCVALKTPPVQCPAGMELYQGQCACPAGTNYESGVGCIGVPPPPPWLECRTGQVPDGKGGCYTPNPNYPPPIDVPVKRECPQGSTMTYHDWGPQCESDVSLLQKQQAFTQLCRQIGGSPAQQDGGGRFAVNCDRNGKTYTDIGELQCIARGGDPAWTKSVPSSVQCNPAKKPQPQQCPSGQKQVCNTRKPPQCKCQPVTGQEAAIPLSSKCRERLTGEMRVKIHSALASKSLTTKNQGVQQCRQLGGKVRQTNHPKTGAVILRCVCPTTKTPVVSTATTTSMQKIQPATAIKQITPSMIY